MDGKDWTRVSFDEGRQTLRKWRENNVRRSEEAVEIWEHVLSRHPNSLGDELWIVYEQIVVASLDCARLDIAQECLQALSTQFTNSDRVLKLRAMHLECVGKLVPALKIYDDLIKRDESNPAYRKRKIAVMKAQGRMSDAIKELTDYLKKFMNDTEAWQELSHLYLSEQDYGKAAYCVEELILSFPRDHLFYQYYAEIKYTQGGLDNIELAKSYFAEAAKLNPKNVRALWGLLSTCSQLAQKATSQKRKELINTANVAAAKLSDVYKQQKEAITSPAMQAQFDCIETMLKSVQAPSGDI